MIAYNRTGLDNLAIRNEAQAAFDAGCITCEENTKIETAYPVNFYTPNIFICIGLFLLTVLIACCTLGLFTLFNMGGSESSSFLLIFFGLVCYAALEYTVLKRQHFKSGVDYALLWMSAVLLYTGLFFMFNNMSITFQCIIALTISLLLTLRFANIVMALVAYSSLLVFIINISAEINRTIELLIPFILMAVSVATWLLSVRVYKLNSRHYHTNITAIKVASLTSFYLAGNYFVVREMSVYMFGPGATIISLGWLFWILTTVTPLVYLYQGIRKKDSLFLWTGLALIAASVFTIRYYYHIMPVEWALILGGLLLISAAYGLIRYLKIPKYGFTSAESSSRHLLENLHLESLVIAETFAGAGDVKAPASDFQFGGGSGGGGGAGGEY